MPAMFIVPVLVGAGKRSLPSGVRAQLHLLDERRFGGGVVHLRYACERQWKPAAGKVGTSREGIPRQRSHTGSARKAGRALIAAESRLGDREIRGRDRAVIRKPSCPIPEPQETPPSA